jgi:putative restriction endonuclease
VLAVRTDLADDPLGRINRVAKAIFTTKVDPAYDDLPEQHYHFPRTYLRQIEAAVGDWIVYYEPRRSSPALSSSGGRQAYFATAQLKSVVPDPTTPDHFYAYVDTATYLEFDHAVPFREGEHYYESLLRKEDGSTNKGAFGRAVRGISDTEYELILQAGFVATLDAAMPAPASKPGVIATRIVPELAEEDAAFERSIVERLVARPFRDRAFATGVVSAYNKTCAVTGLQIINGGGRAEVQAAHIKAVEHGGSDSVRNGVALSGTVHWMFDRGLISIDDNYDILVAEDRLPDAAKRLIREERQLLLPERDDVRPHRSYLKFHRDRVFKG